MKLGLLFLVVLGMSSALTAQILTGTVVNSAGTGVANAKISFKTSKAKGVSAADGSFSIDFSAVSTRDVPLHHHTLSGNTLNLASVQEAKLVIFDQAGRKVLSTEGKSAALTLDFAGIHEGIYFMSLKTTEMTYPTQRINVGKNGVIGKITLGAPVSLSKTSAPVDSLIVDAETYAIKKVGLQDYTTPVNVKLATYVPIDLHKIGFFPTAVWCGDGSSCNIIFTTDAASGCPAGSVGGCFGIEWPEVDPNTGGAWAGGGWTLNGNFPTVPVAVDPTATKIKFKIAGDATTTFITIGTSLKGVEAKCDLTPEWQEMTIDIAGKGAYSPLTQPLFWVFTNPGKFFIADIYFTR